MGFSSINMASKTHNSNFITKIIKTTYEFIKYFIFIIFSCGLVDYYRKHSVLVCSASSKVITFFSGDPPFLHQASSTIITFSPPPPHTHLHQVSSTVIDLPPPIDDVVFACSLTERTRNPLIPKGNMCFGEDILMFL